MAAGEDGEREPLKKSALPQPNPSSISWDTLIPLLAALSVFLFPFFPDEKLIRVKLQVLELSLFSLVALGGLRIIFEFREDAPTPFFKKIDLLTWAIFGWVAVMAFLWALSADKALAGNEMRRVLLALAAYAGFLAAGSNQKYRRYVILAWALASGLLALYGLLQRSGGVGFLLVPKMTRVMGTFGNPIFFAAYLLPGFFLTLAALSLVKNPSLRLLLWLSAAVHALALYFTETRAAWIAFALSLAVGLFLKTGWRRVPKWAWMAGILGAGIFITQTKNVWLRDQAHVLIWRDTLRMWIDHPLKGVGLGAFHTNFQRYAQEDLRQKWPKENFIVNYTHNEYLQMLVEGGVSALLSFLAVIFFFFRQVFQEFRHSREGGNPVVYNLSLKDKFAKPDPRLRGDDGFILSLGALALLLQNFFSVDFRFSVSFANLFMLMGLGNVRPREATNTPSPVPSRKGKGISFRVGMGIGWVVFLAFVVFPYLRKPYHAQKTVAQTPDFFHMRVVDAAKSIQDLEALAIQYPNEPSVLEKLAFVYAKEMKTRDNQLNSEMAQKAIRAYAKLAELDPNSTAAYNNLANIHYTLGRVEEAISYWRKAIQVEPQFRDAHLNLGKVLYVKGELKESARHFNQVLKLDPGNAEALIYLRRMVE